jgi:hypothetical protein
VTLLPTSDPVPDWRSAQQDRDRKDDDRGQHCLHKPQEEQSGLVHPGRIVEGHTLRLDH